MSARPLTATRRSAHGALLLSCGWLAGCALRAQPLPPLSSATPLERAVTLESRWEVLVSSPARRLEVVVLLPPELPGRQEILDLRLSPPPTRIFEEAGRSYAQFTFERPRSGDAAVVEVDLLLRESGLAFPGTPADAGEVASALVPEPYLVWEGRGVQRGLGRLAAEGEEAIVPALQLVQRRLRYPGYLKEDRGAEVAWRTRRGDCTDYTDLLVALLRAKGVPARHVEGYVTRWDPSDTPKHSWAEVWLRERGWVPLDALHVELGFERIDRISPSRVVVSDTRNDPTLLGFHFGYYRWWGGEVRVEDELLVRPLAVPPERSLR